MIKLLSLFFLAAPLFAQSSIPIFSNVGPLTCGLRVYTPGQVQTWCFWAPAGVTPVTVCNELDVIRSLDFSAPVALTHFCMATDVPAGSATGTTYQIGWLAWQPIVALPPGTTGTIQYQIVTSTAPCVLSDPTAPAGSPPGVCVQTAAPVTNLVTGTIPSGLAVAEDLWPREWVLTWGLDFGLPWVYRIDPSSPLARVP